MHVDATKISFSNKAIMFCHYVAVIFVAFNTKNTLDVIFDILNSTHKMMSFAEEMIFLFDWMS